VNGPSAYRLRHVVQAYDWGATTALSDLLGIESDGRPQAELWLGGHPVAPSEALVDGNWVPLDRLVASDPGHHLGAEVVEHFGQRLPFLFKVLAAARPLSLQVHPDLAQAREGYAREEAAAIPRRAPHRTYRDRNHKPEVLVALTPFDALTGFRDPQLTVELFTELLAAGASELRPWRDRLAAGDLAGCFWRMWDLEPAECAELVDSVANGASALASGSQGASGGRGGWGREAHWARRLAELHPQDAGVAVALLLNLVTLEPGQAIYAPAGRLHAYLEGVGLELMASSDNVIRGGLTTKHVDLAELEHVLSIRAEDPEPFAGRPDDGATVYDTPAPDFRLSRVELDGRGRRAVRPCGPELLLCLAGSVRVSELTLARGESAFVPAGSAYQLSGLGSVWRATVGDLAQRREPERRRRDR
jgi:mannose-6-phosphate isomerase